MNKIKMAKAGLELAERLYQQLWNEFGGVYIGKTVYNIGKGCRRDGKIYKEEGLFPVGFPMYPQLYDMMEQIKAGLTPGTFRAAMAECMKQYTFDADRWMAFWNRVPQPEEIDFIRNMAVVE